MGYFLAVLSVFLWSFNVIVSRYFSNVFSPVQISFLRWALVVIILFPFIIKDVWKNSEKLYKNWKIILALSVIGIVIMNNLTYVAGKTISAVDMSLFAVLGPIFLLILSHCFLKTVITKKQILGISISFIGVITIILQGKFLSIGNFKFAQGDFYMLLFALSFGVYSILMIKKPKNISGITLLFVMALIGTLIKLPLFLYGICEHPIIWNLNIKNILIFLYLALFNSIIAFLGWNYALVKIGGIKASMIYYLMPVFSSVSAYFILGEKIHPSQIYGGILVLLGIILSNKKEKAEIERP